MKKFILIGIIILIVAGSCNSPTGTDSKQATPVLTTSANKVADTPASQKNQTSDTIIPTIPMDSTKTDLQTNETPKTNLDKKFFGLWLLQTDQKIGSISPQFQARYGLAFQPNKEPWFIRYQTNGISVYFYNAEIDNEFISFPTHASALTLKFKYKFLSDDSMELTEFSGEKALYKRISPDASEKFISYMMGNWQCEYDAGYGETKTVALICDELGKCKGPLKTNGYILSEFSYIPQFSAVTKLQNYDDLQKAFITDPITMSANNGYYLAKYQKTGSKIALDSAFMAGLLGGTPEKNKINEAYFYPSCTRVGE